MVADNFLLLHLSAAFKQLTTIFLCVVSHRSLFVSVGCGNPTRTSVPYRLPPVCNYGPPPCRKRCNCSQNVPCDKSNGNCICGFREFGVKCKPCPHGKFFQNGTTCQGTCRCYDKYACRAKNGECVGDKGCLYGWEGRFCNKYIKHKMYSKYAWIGVAILSGISGMMYIIIRWRLKHDHRIPNGVTDTKSNDSFLLKMKKRKMQQTLKQDLPLSSSSKTESCS